MVISKEWIEQVLNSRIQRKIDGIRINQVDLTVTSPGRVAYVVYVPQSERAPHQAHDRKFYKRFNFESTAMEEYEIRDISNRVSGPSLTIVPQVKTLSLNSGIVDAEFTALIENISANPAEYIVVNFLFDLKLQFPSGYSELSHNGVGQLIVGEKHYQCNVLGMNHSIPGKIPIIAGLQFRLFETPVHVRFLSSGNFICGYTILSPKMTPKTQSFQLINTGQNIVVEL